VYITEFSPNPEPRMSTSGLLFIDHAPFLGGAETVLLDIIRSLDRSRFEPIVATPAGSALMAPLGASGIRCIATPLPPLNTRNPLALLPVVQSIRHLRAIILQEHINLVHANTVRAHILAALATPSHIPLIWHLHDDTFPRGLFSLLQRRPCRIIANSHFIASHYGLTNEPRCTVVYNGVAIEPLAARHAALRTQWHIPEDSPLIVNVGRLARWKGQDVFIKAAALVIAQCPQARFMIVGGYERDDQGQGELSGGRAYYDELVALRDSLGLTDHVVFTDHIADMQPVYAAADLVVHTATRPEPFGRVIVEAMAAGVPVIASNSGGPAEIVVDGECGYLIPPGNPSTLAESMLKLMADSDLRQQMGRTGRQRVQALFDLRTQVREIETIYDSIVYK